MVDTRAARRRPSPIDTAKSPPASPAKAPFPVIKLPADFTVDAAELGADVLASKMAALDVVAVVKTAAAVRKAPRRMMSVKKAPQTVQKKKPKPKEAPPPPCLKTVFKALPHACRSTDSELRAIERRVATLDVHAAVETKGGWEGPPSRSLLGLPPPALHIEPAPAAAPAPAEDRPARQTTRPPRPRPRRTRRGRRRRDLRRGHHLLLRRERGGQNRRGAPRGAR